MGPQRIWTGAHQCWTDAVGDAGAARCDCRPARGADDKAEMSISQQLNAEIAVVAENVRHSLVQIKNGRRRGSAATIWHPGALILTNTHVVGRRSLQVSL